MEYQFDFDERAVNLWNKHKNSLWLAFLYVQFKMLLQQRNNNQIFKLLGSFILLICSIFYMARIPTVVHLQILHLINIKSILLCIPILLFFILKNELSLFNEVKGSYINNGDYINFLSKLNNQSIEFVNDYWFDKVENYDQALHYYDFFKYYTNTKIYMKDMNKTNLFKKVKNKIWDHGNGVNNDNDDITEVLEK